jgi:hypothetical protein
MSVSSVPIFVGGDDYHLPKVHQANRRKQFRQPLHRIFIQKFVRQRWLGRIVFTLKA